MTKILCVASDLLSEETTGREVVKLASQHGQWLERDEVETDKSVRQIIPYIVMTSVNDKGEGTVFAFERLEGGDEDRLHNKWSVGVGGHVDETDNHRGSPVIDCAYREIKEEIKIPENYAIDVTPDPLAALYRSDTIVDQVHIGVVFAAEIFERSTSTILQTLESNEPNKIQGQMYTSIQLHQMLESGEKNFELWSQDVIKMMKDGSESEASTVPG